MNAGFFRRRWFYVSLAAVLLVIVAVGFERSFYLRHVLNAGNTRRSTLPAYLTAHGIALTLWFLLFLAQTLLVSFGRVRLHRSLGAVGAVLAGVVFVLSMLVVVRSVVRETSLVVIGDIALLILFAILVTASIHFRRKPQVHKRLMAIASISIVAPAIARWPGAQSMLPLSVVLPQLLLYGAQVIYDVRSSRRLHPATAWGVLGYVLAVGITIPLATSTLGHRFVNSLKSRQIVTGSPTSPN
jgi:hypothetical protein